jgi:hypothetical protein
VEILIMMRLALIVTYLVCLTSNAWAYLDPGTGSILLQGLIAALATSLFFLRSSLDRLRGFVGRLARGSRGDK